MRRGVVAEFEDPERLLGAVLAMKAEGFNAMDAYTPYAVQPVIEALDLPRSRVPLYCLLAGVFGGCYAYLIQFWMNGFDFAINVGGRPLGSAPAFIPPTFEGTVLLAALMSIFSFLGFAGLPQVAAPIFSVEGFERASIDRYFLALEELDPRYDPEIASAVLRKAGALRITFLPVPEPAPVPNPVADGPVA
ncbi:DUF3341 domain-containing protein [Vulgatibacter incomptus]|uniref:ABC-type Fe3+ transport system protein n=1 Tax=Vulgatibacter incomptus TaxID=1391653 RepID=A0A0K1P9R0_9BACT|nr:DUF3341 domain-containing protein [Vulgatibacter incomptus]AKU90250.1 ABC-type Fe3+ transport system protein [Vulgatibacter incomptus]